MTGEDERIDRMTARLSLIQRRRGHRAGSDDVLLASIALARAPGARRLLDLGSGQGTVALLLVDQCSELFAIGIEAQEVSHDLAVRNAHLNGLSERYQPVHGDMRDAALLTDEAQFDLVTGAPPFMRPGSGVPPRDVQRAAARFEYRGGVEAYLAAACRWGTATADIVLLMDAKNEARTLRAFDDSEIAVVERLDVAPRPGRAPIYQIYCGRRGADPSSVHRTLTMRDTTDDVWSATYRAMRLSLGLSGGPGLAPRR